MVTLLFIISLLLTVFCLKKSSTSLDEGTSNNYGVLGVLFCAAAMLLLFWGGTLINDVTAVFAIDDKITMYEEENASIEKSIDVAVRSYMDYEASTYGELKDKDAINLVSLYPELKSDTLVQEQINIYVANNDKIKQLKEEKINLSKVKWMLYFGR